MFDIKRLLHVLLAASLLGSAATAIASAASHPSGQNHAAARSHDRDGDKSKRDPSEDKRDKADKRDKGDQGDQGDQRDHRNPPA